MKFNWKVAVAFILIAVAIVFGITSTSASSHAGKNLTFAVGTGSVSITNSSDVAIPAQFIGTGTRSFSVTSSIDDVSGSSDRDGSGSSTTQTFAFELPSGVHEFTVVRGKDVSFIAETDTNLQATVQPLSSSESSMMMAAIGIFALAALYFISQTTKHQWIGIVRSKMGKPDESKPSEELELGQGVNLKSYGDNRS